MVRGSPTKIWTAPRSLASRTSTPMSLSLRASRFRVRMGVARMQSGSLPATPTLAIPTSTPSRTPGWRPDGPLCVVMQLTPVGNRAGDRRQGVLDLGRVAAAALGHVVLAAAAAAEHPGRLLDQRTGLDTGAAGGLVRGHDDQRPRIGNTRDGDHCRLAAEPVAQVKGQRPQVVRGTDLAGIVG